MLDAGHGGLDSGAVGKSGVLEKDVNLSVVKHLQQLLELSGFRTVLTRDEDISIYDPGVEGIRNQKLSDMDNRLEIIQSYPDSIFLCIHQNNYTDPKYFGGQMFYNNNNPDNRTLAQIMQARFAQLQPGNDREIKLSGDDCSCSNPTRTRRCDRVRLPFESRGGSEARHRGISAAACVHDIQRRAGVRRRGVGAARKRLDGRGGRRHF